MDMLANFTPGSSRSIQLTRTRARAHTHTTYLSVSVVAAIPPRTLGPACPKLAHLRLAERFHSPASGLVAAAAPEATAAKAPTKASRSGPVATAATPVGREMRGV